MSLEAWGDCDEAFGPPDGYCTEQRACELFVAGLQAMREMLARGLEQAGDPVSANILRQRWNPSWGKDPGRPEKVIDEPWEA